MKIYGKAVARCFCCAVAVLFLTLIQCAPQKEAYSEELNKADDAQSLQNAAAGNEKENSSAQNEATSDYEYQLAARPDPFKPFIAQKASGGSLEPSVAEGNEGPMQRFEPHQLTLVAVMDMPRGRIAMVEDVTQKGYILKEGVLIGKNGVVTDIRKDQVVVTETTTTPTGDEVKRIVSIKLKRDGEEK